MAAGGVGEFAHEVVEPAVGGPEFAQRREGEERGPARPEKQGQMGEVAAGDHRLGDAVESSQRSHGASAPPSAGMLRADAGQGGRSGWTFPLTRNATLRTLRSGFPREVGLGMRQDGPEGRSNARPTWDE